MEAKGVRRCAALCPHALGPVQPLPGTAAPEGGRFSTLFVAMNASTRKVHGAFFVKKAPKN